jgi:DNA helicase-2/ATP-dependent DNA helicase PcrA
MKRLGVDTKQTNPNMVRSIISSNKNNMKSAAEYSREAASGKEKLIAMLYDNYERDIRANNAMDFDDLLLNMIRLLEKSQDMLDKYQDKFRYILVDEYQDTNRAQYVVINKLANRYRNICVVGDDAQSIYKWRGADIRNILDFQKDYHDGKVVRLEQNYRSTKTIIEAADSVIAHNKNQIPKKLWTENVDGEKIQVLASADDKKEAELIASIISTNLKHGFTMKDFAVLYRTNAQSMQLENHFRRNGLKYDIIGGVSFYKRKEIKDALAYIKILINPKDSESFMRVVNEPPRGIGTTTLENIRQFGLDRGMDFFDAFMAAELNPLLKKRAILSVKEFAALIQTYVGQKEKLKPAELIIKYIEATGLLKMYEEIGTEESKDRWNNVQQLLSDISSYFRVNPDNTLEEYMQQVALITDLDTTEFGKEKVTLMTVHAAKGLEFPVVFVAGLEKGLFPLGKSDEITEDLEEERRLFYVAVTRAEQKLFLSYAQKRMRFGETSYQIPSLFLDEINLELLDWKIKEVPKNKFVAPAKPQRDTGFFNDIPPQEDYSQVPRQTPVKEIKLNIGDRVMHPVFGEGQISGMTGLGTQRKVIVNFKNVGKKTLMLKFAKLSKA